VKALVTFFEQGGPVMYALGAISIVLYWQCFSLLAELTRVGREWRRLPRAAPGARERVRRERTQVQEAFRYQRMMLGSMIAAAPLCGLLGTVSGMSRTFETLSRRVGQQSMEDLAGGISEVLVATQTGLAVAIPALLLVYLAHRLVQRRVQEAAVFETAARQEVAP
jgi:biopolymer transport protein ExbB